MQIKFYKCSVFINSVLKLVESNELLSKDLLDFIESYKVRRIHILFYKYTRVNMHNIT